MIKATFAFLDTGRRPGQWNMDFDVRRAEMLDRGECLPTVRVYGWDPWCISLGRNQNPEDIDAEACRKDGIDIVTRPTGGRAILHAQEVTYSVIMPAEDRGIMEVYQHISAALVDGLRELAGDLTWSKTRPDFTRLYREPGGISCFASSARYEIEFNGRKLVGSAQRRIGNVVLQHGSILLDDAHLQLTRYLRIDSDARDLVRRDLEAHTITLRKILGRAVFPEEVRTCLRKGFSRAWNVEFIEEILNETTVSQREV